MDLAGKEPICNTKIWVSGRLECKTRITRLTWALQETEMNQKFATFHDTWCKTVLGFREISSKTRARIIRYGGNYSELCGVMFWLYGSVVFLLNVL